MPPPKKTPPSPNESNVRPIKRGVGTLQPPGGREWQLRNELGQFMRFKPGDGGRLVRLADVMRWHEETMSRESALKALCDRLPPDVMNYLYKVEKNKEPIPVPADAMFGYRSPGKATVIDGTERGERYQITLSQLRKDMAVRREW